MISTAWPAAFASSAACLSRWPRILLLYQPPRESRSTCQRGHVIVADELEALVADVLRDRRYEPTEGRRANAQRWQ